MAFHGSARDGDDVFKPIKIGSLGLPNRLVMAAMAIHLAPMTGELFHETTEFFLERAKGGVGLIMMGATGWARMDAAHPSIPDEKVGLYKEDLLERHKRLVDALKKTGVKIGIQLNHRGRQATREPFDYRPVAPSSIPWSPRAEVPQTLSISEIKNLIERYGRGAGNAKKVGFDLVEIHAAHGYLVSNFLSPDSNKREDEYGGDVHGRVKFLLDIIKCVRENVGSNFPISVRLNGSDFKKEGLTVKESKKIGGLLEQSKVDLISVSAGVYGSYPMTIPPFYTEPACFVPLSEEIKKEVRMPVAVAGRIHEIALAQRILGEGKADLIALGRPLLADPYVPLKWMQGDEKDIRKCIYCNYCIDTYWAGRNACVVNPSMGREKEFELKPAKRTKTIWVIGAGLAGMEVAWRASVRGHSVKLFDKQSDPGGLWTLASKPPGKEHFQSIIDHLLNRIGQTGVKTFWGKTIEKEKILKENPDVVVMATGAEPSKANIDGFKESEYILAWDILKGNIPAQGENYLVIGGGAVGLEVAHLLATKGKKVTVVEMQEQFGIDMGDTIRWSLIRILRNHDVKLIPSLEVKYSDQDYLYVIEKGTEMKWKKFDMHVLAMGLEPRDELLNSLSDFKGELYIIGDAKQPRKGADAIREGAEIGNFV
jgi:2,4-dienoyl-CoA reductase-like NADH-dependent reductase (Old Yellow Enzyme family)/thioredoxin reductase